MITLILTQLAGGRKFDSNNPRQTAELAKRDLRLAVPTAFASAIDVDGRSVVIACVGSDGDSRAETAFSNWYAQTPEGAVYPALERNNVAAVITSAGIPADPAAMFADVLELHTSDAPFDPNDSFGALVVDQLQDKLRQVDVLASLSLGTVNNAHSDSILTAASTTQEKATVMTTENPLPYNELLETIRKAAATVSKMSSTRPDSFFTDAQSLERLINVAVRTGSMDKDSAAAIRGDVETFVDLLSFAQSSDEVKPKIATSVPVAEVEELPEVEEVEEVEDDEEEDEEVEDDYVDELPHELPEEAEEPEVEELPEVEDEDDEDSYSVTGYVMVDNVMVSLANGIALTDAEENELSEGRSTEVHDAVCDALNQMSAAFPDLLDSEYNAEDVASADHVELGGMLYNALTIVYENFADAPEAMTDILSELDDALENIRIDAAIDNEDYTEEQQYDDDVTEADDMGEDDDVTEDMGEEVIGESLELVSVELRPRLIVALTTDIDQNHFGTDLVTELRAVESADGSQTYNLALGINSPGVKRNNPDGFFRTPLLEISKQLGKLPNGMIMLPQSIAESTDPQDLVNAIGSVMGESLDNIFNGDLVGKDRLPLDEDDNLVLGFEDEGEDNATLVSMHDLVSCAVSADTTINVAGAQVIDLNVFITLRLIGLRHLNNKAQIVSRLCSLASRMAGNGVSVVPAFVYSSSKYVYGSEVEREEIATLHQAFDDMIASDDRWSAVGIISSQSVEGNLDGTGIISAGELLSLEDAASAADSEAYLASELMDIVNSSEVENLFALGGNVAVVLINTTADEADADADADEE